MSLSRAVCWGPGSPPWPGSSIRRLPPGICAGARVEQGTFSWPKSAEPQTTKLRLAPEALALLTDGVDLRGTNLRPWYERDGA